MQIELKGIRLKELRERAGLTQEFLAEKLETRQSVISNMERGGFMPSVDNALRIIAVLREAGLIVGLDDFYEYDQIEGKVKTNSTKEPIPVMG